MDLLTILRTAGALGIVLGLLVGTLYAVRRFDLRMPTDISNILSRDKPERRLQLVERLAIDMKRSVALIRHDGTEHLVLISPEGVLRLDGRQAPLESKAAESLVDA